MKVGVSKSFQNSEIWKLIGPANGKLESLNRRVSVPLEVCIGKDSRRDSLTWSRKDKGISQFSTDMTVFIQKEMNPEAKSWMQLPLCERDLVTCFVLATECLPMNVAQDFQLVSSFPCIMLMQYFVLLLLLNCLGNQMSFCISSYQCR